MPCKLLIIKQTRKLSTTPFYSTPEAAKVALRLYGPPAVVGERNFADGLVRVRTLLFPTVADYENWLVNPVTAMNVVDRVRYNNLNAIIETQTVFDVAEDNLSNIES